MPTVPQAVPQDPIRRYSNGNVAFHWVTVGLVITQAILGFAFHGMEQGALRDQLFTWHKTIGPLILLITLARLTYRLSNPPPPYPPDLPRWEQVVGTWNHRIFYLLLIVLPVAGLVAVSGHEQDGATEIAFGLPFPLIPGVGRELGELAGEVHVMLVYVLIAAILLHAGAALKHQFIDRWPVSGRMPPFQMPGDIPVVIGQGSKGRPPTD